MAKKPSVSLETFAEGRRKSSKGCWACSVPERPEIDAGRKAGISVKAISDWLEHCGYPSTFYKLQHHFYQNHHDENSK